MGASLRFRLLAALAGLLLMLPTLLVLGFMWAVIP